MKLQRHHGQAVERKAQCGGAQRQQGKQRVLVHAKIPFKINSSSLARLPSPSSLDSSKMVDNMKIFSFFAFSGSNTRHALNTAGRGRELQEKYGRILDFKCPPLCSGTGCGSQQLLRIRSYLAGRCPNNFSLFPPLAAVVVVAYSAEILFFYFAFVAACGTCRGKAPPSADADRSPLKSPTGAFIATQTRAAPNAFSRMGL